MAATATEPADPSADLSQPIAILEGSPRRAQQLLGITAAIAEAVTPEQVYAAVVDQVAAVLGASSAALWRTGQGRGIRLVRAMGYAEAARRRVEAVDLDDPFPLPAIHCIARAAPLWIDSQAEMLAAYPHLRGLATEGRSYRIACLPIVVQERVLGALALSFDDAPPIDDEHRGFLLVVARYAAQALERLRLLDAERAQRRRAELLYELAHAVIGADALDAVFTASLDAIAEGLGAPRAAILTFDDDGVMRFRAWRGLSEPYRAAVEGHSPWSRDTRDAQPIVVADVATDAALAGLLPALRDEHIGALAFIPLVAGQRLVGKFMVYFERPYALAPAELELARAIGDHVAAALARFTAVVELRETVRFNELFTGILGHDLRNPLAAIATGAQLALMRNTDDKLQKPLTRILSSSERMARMIEQLLDFTRMRLGGGIPLSTRELDLVPLVRQVMDELDDANPEWTLRLDHRGDTAGRWDEDRLAQVFSNLVANAVQHGRPADGLDVRIDGTAPDVVRVETHNTGTIPAELLPRLFEPLTGGSRGHNRSRGLGLGLHITREIVRGHGGRIEARSDDAGGTTFVITLPRGT